MKYKVSELEGALLDAAVAKAEGLPVHPGRDFVVADNLDAVYAHEIAPSTEWDQGGPIIERERININFRDGECWQAFQNGRWSSFGPHPLIAAMRAYVASKFGDEVDLP